MHQKYWTSISYSNILQLLTSFCTEDVCKSFQGKLARPLHSSILCFDLHFHPVAAVCSFHEVFRELEWLFEMFRKNVVSCNSSANLTTGVVARTSGSEDKYVYGQKAIANSFRVTFVSACCGLCHTNRLTDAIL